MMELTAFQLKIATLFPQIEMKYNEHMSKHTSFKIGGPVEVMAFPKSINELSDLLKQSALLDCKPAILGAGTNVLAPDHGISGLVICLKDCLDGMERLDESHIRVAAGVTMTRAAVYAAGLGLSGMEFAHGIPGTVGGGVFMNAGAYGGEIKDICKSVDVMDSEGTIHTFTAEQMQFSYRHSCLEESGGIVVSAVFELLPNSPAYIRAQMLELANRRKASQPLDKPSAGSAFKRPATGYAAALIDQAGLRGFRIGDAAVSEKHTGFVVNLGNATACQVREVLQTVAERVKENSGVELEPEVRIW